MHEYSCPLTGQRIDLDFYDKDSMPSVVRTYMDVFPIRSECESINKGACSPQCSIGKLLKSLARSENKLTGGK